MKIKEQISAKNHQGDRIGLLLISKEQFHYRMCYDEEEGFDLILHTSHSRPVPGKSDLYRQVHDFVEANDEEFHKKFL